MPQGWIRKSLLLTALMVVTGRATGAAERQTLHGHMPSATETLFPRSRMSGAEHLNLAIGLPLRNAEMLTDRLQQIYNPASPNYRQYLTVAQFTELFGPTEPDYQALIQFAETNGLTVIATHPNRVVLDVTGTVADIEKAFHLRMGVYEHPKEARTFHAPDAEPSLLALGFHWFTADRNTPQHLDKP